MRCSRYLLIVVFGVCLLPFYQCGGPIEKEHTSEKRGDASVQDTKGNRDFVCSTGATKPCYTGDPKTRDKGECRSGKSTCYNGIWSECVGSKLPVDKDLCDKKDNDCDGIIDEDCTCHKGDTRSCYTNKQGCKKVGSLYNCTSPCQSGTQTCQNGDWSECTGAVIPSVESCNGKDDDCDGKIDNLPDLGKDCTLEKAQGECRAGSWICRLNKKICLAHKSPEIEKCDGLDNDCDGQTDEELKPIPCDKNAGVCSGAMKKCNGTQGWTRCKIQDYEQHSSAYEAKETKCDGLDNDCDGSVDAHCPCQIGKKRACYGFGTGCKKVNGGYQCTAPCLVGVQTCSSGTWGACTGAVGPTTEICDGKDNDCNGQVDDGLTAPLCVKQKGCVSERRSSVVV